MAATSPSDIWSALGQSAPSVGRRSTRTHSERELWCLWHWLQSACGDLNFPLVIEKSEAPDFLLNENGAITGIEITEATDPADQRAMTLAERTEREVFFLGEFGGRAGKNGFAGAQVEAMWVTDVLNAVRKKARKKFTTNNVILVVYPNGDYPALHEDEAVALLYEFSEHSSNVEEFRVFARVDVLLREPARIASVSR